MTMNPEIAANRHPALPVAIVAKPAVGRIAKIKRGATARLCEHLAAERDDVRLLLRSMGPRPTLLL